jgi:TPR repeat protein
MGEGTLKDEKAAFNWYQEASDSGNVNAQYALAKRYLSGDGVQTDPAVALRWFLKAAEQGHPDAQYSAAKLLQKGLGTEKDPKAASLWYEKRRCRATRTRNTTSPACSTRAKA